MTGGELRQDLSETGSAGSVAVNDYCASDDVDLGDEGLRVRGRKRRIVRDPDVAANQGELVQGAYVLQQVVALDAQVATNGPE